MKRLLAVLCACFALSTYAVDYCYIGFGGGRSTISVSGTDRLEDRVLALDHVSGSYREKNTSTTTELQFGCVFLPRFGLKVAGGIHEGIRHVVETEGTVTYLSLQERFSLKRVVRARGYSISLIGEKEVLRELYGSVRIGAIYALATGDVYPMGSKYSVLHVEEEALVPLLGVGFRYGLTKSLSVVGEIRAHGIPWDKEKRVSEALIGLQYSLH